MTTLATDAAPSHTFAPDTPPPERTDRRVALASLAGTTIEFYDYFIYGTAAALVFNKVFFPNLSPTMGAVAALATLAVVFVFRPSARPCSGTSGTGSAASARWSSR
ncbi:hypothetical protein ACFQV8_35335 [Pseudonocardia benzenivorans]